MKLRKQYLYGVIPVEAGSSFMRNSFFAIAINKLFRAYWFVVRPKTQGVKALVFNQGKILMVRLTYYPNTWTFPGGGVNKNETIENAVVRESYEEVGVTLRNPKYLGDIDFDHEYKKDTVSIFEGIVDNSEIKIDGKEVAEANWFELNNLPFMGKNAKRIIEFYKNNR